MYKLFGVNIENCSLPEVLSRLAELMVSGGHHLVVTANPEIMVEAWRNAKYRKVLRSASLVVADGTGVVLASYLFGRPLTKGRVTGVDLVEALVRESGNGQYSVFLAGSTAEVLNKTTHYLSSKYNNINIVGKFGANSTGPYSKSDYEIFSMNLLKSLNYAKPDVLLLALGHPKQEMWIAEHMEKMSVKIAIGVGGTFDFLSGNVVRSPRWMRTMGLEWLFRLIIEPSRWRRIFNAVVLFPAILIFEAIKNVFHVEHNSGQ